MDVKLPNGTIIKNVPESTTKEQVKQKAIAAGLAKAEDFPTTIENPNDFGARIDFGGDTTPQPQPERSLADKAIGAGEAALSAVTGATTGAVGGLIGTAEGVADAIRQGRFGTQAGVDLAQQRAMEYMGDLTYTPKTDAGNEYLQIVGEVAGALPAASGIAAELQAGGMAARQAGQAARAGLDVAGGQAAKLAPKPATQNGALSVGAAEVGGGLEAQRATRAAELPVPVQLTKGQRTQDFAQQQFERETAKMGEEGAALRQRFQEQNQALVQNFDAFLDDVGTTLPETAYKLQTGQKIDEALRKRSIADKARIRVAYKEAEKAGETESPVNLGSVAEYLNDNRAEAGLAPIMQAISKQIEVQGVGSGSLLDGTLQVGEMTLNQAERLRKAVNKFSKGADANNLRVAGEIKQLIDSATEGAGGEKYQIARKLRKQYADNYERIGIVKNILGTKRNSSDRQIALEDVVDKVVLNGSVNDLSEVRRLLQTQGADGMAAWREMQASTIRHIRDQATKGVGQDQNGNPLVNAGQLNRIINALDSDGKLDKIFGKKGAEQLRDVRDIARDVIVSQPNAVNNSNTSSALIAALDLTLSAMSGLPAPVATGARALKAEVTKRKIQKKVAESLK